MDSKKLDIAVTAAIAQLNSHQRGKDCLKAFKELMTKYGYGLDTPSGHALCVLVLAAIKEHRIAWITDLKID